MIPSPPRILGTVVLAPSANMYSISTGNEDRDASPTGGIKTSTPLLTLSSVPSLSSERVAARRRSRYIACPSGPTMYPPGGLVSLTLFAPLALVSPIQYQPSHDGDILLPQRFVPSSARWLLPSPNDLIVTHLQSGAYALASTMTEGIFTSDESSAMPKGHQACGLTCLHQN